MTLHALDQKLAALELAQRAKLASRTLAQQDRVALLRDAADLLAQRTPAPLLDRLRLDESRMQGVVQAVRDVAALPDPVGEVVEAHTRPNGLRVERVRVPLGVILMIYEARPNVTAEAAALCLRSGNAALLRGGTEALQSNSAILDCFSGAGDAVQLVPPARALLDELLKLDELIDLCIPRGGPSLIRMIAENARIPVIKHYLGVCHLFVAADADLEMAERLIVNGKTQRPAVCNALECVLLDRPVADAMLERMARAMPQVELRRSPGDYGREFLDLKLAVAVVDGLDGALAHIARYGSKHTESICTRDAGLAERFIAGVDASCVLWNASTRFNDGGELGLGAEIGISTSKLHAYGPMGLRELTTTRFVVRGDGQTRR